VIVHEAFSAQLYGDTPLGRPILGTVDSINSITREQIFEHYQARYAPENLVIAAAGNLEHDAVLTLVEPAFGGKPHSGAQPAPARLDGEGLTDAELARGKGQVRDSIVLGLEDPSSRMSRLGKSELVYPRLEPVDEILARVDTVTHDDIRAVACDTSAAPRRWPSWAPLTRRTHSRPYLS
jgi:predicted Zn-dependent peptidase